MASVSGAPMEKLRQRIADERKKEAAQAAASATSALGAQADADKAKSQLSIGKRRRRSTADGGLAKKTLLGG